MKQISQKRTFPFHTLPKGKSALQKNPAQDLFYQYSCLHGSPDRSLLSPFQVYHRSYPPNQSVYSNQMEHFKFQHQYSDFYDERHHVFYNRIYSLHRGLSKSLFDSIRFGVLLSDIISLHNVKKQQRRVRGKRAPSVRIKRGGCQAEQGKDDSFSFFSPLLFFQYSVGNSTVSVTDHHSDSVFRFRRRQ